jgi:hypothetical protein
MHYYSNNQGKRITIIIYKFVDNMKRKLTYLLFGLLLAVGWTNVASAQAYLLKADDMATWTYKWLPENATDSVEEHYVELVPKTGKYAAKEVTDPYQIYDLLRHVYMDKRFPGHFYSAYTSDGQRENPTYYGGIEGGWNIPYGPTGSGTSTTTYDDIVINTSSYYTNEITYSRIKSIKIIADGVTVSSWDYTTNGNTLPDGWTVSGSWSIDTNGYLYTSSSSNTLTYNGDLLANKNSVQVEIVAYDSDYSGHYQDVYVYVNGSYKTMTASDATYTWTITGTTTSSGTTTPTDVLISTHEQGYQYNYTVISNITVRDADTNELLYSWSGSTTMPDGGYANPTLTRYNNTSYYYMNGGGTIRIAARKFEGHNRITVSVTGNGYFQLCEYSDSYPRINGTDSRTIEFPAVVNTEYYKPDHEGYTALILSIKNNGQIYTEPSEYLGACQFTKKSEVIGYIQDNIKSVKLLTDGLRIGAGDDRGTVFNCDGTYNKFFFLGKGRARKKSSGVLATIGNTSATWPSYACEEVPFKFMFEQFSPTGGDEGDQISDFYIEMMDGAVYPIEHDCASVLQNGHQFSMSGNSGTQAYAMSGMNFLIPDYRLKYWTQMSKSGGHKVDGRDYNPYICADDNGKLDSAYNQASYFAVNYAAYNPDYAPKVGLYLLTLDAEAQPCQGYDVNTNANYTVTLDWTSSLNEMSGGDVPQKYIIYEVWVDSLGVEHLDSITTVANTTHYDFGGKLWPQHDYSETHTYIIMGWPTDSDHPSFIAWSNQDAIVIPGLKDFLALKLDHYESDFDIPNMKNWYRNFLNVSNENEANGLTTDSIYKGYNVFNLMRYENNDSTVAKQVARIVFENQTDGTVKYTISYVDELGNPTQDIEPYDINKPAVYNENHTQIIKPAVNIPNAYQRSTLGIQDVGYLTVSAKGDIIIQPNGYDVNFLKIKVEAGNYSRTWESPSTTLPNGWSVNGGSWILEDGAYYLEGGGFILISAGVLPTNYTTATVTITAYGDTGKTAKIKVNNVSKAILNGSENARDYEWTITNN